MSDQTSDAGQMAAHRATYSGFVRGAIVIALCSAFVLVALCEFAFGHVWPLFMGFGGLIVGFTAVAIDARSGSKTWALALILLVAYGLVTAINVS